MIPIKRLSPTWNKRENGLEGGEKKTKVRKKRGKQEKASQKERKQESATEQKMADKRFSVFMS